MLIPQTIYQTTRSRQQLTEPFIRNLEQMRNLNPGWSIQVFQDEDCYEFIKLYYDVDMLRTYCMINPNYGAARADLFRYLLIYRQGGVYLDIKSTATVRLNSVLRDDDEFILSHWSNARGMPFQGWGVHAETPFPGEFQQWHIVARPQHPFLEQVIRAVQRNIQDYDAPRDGTGKRAVLRVTGPIAYTRAILPFLSQAKSRMVDITKLGFQYSFFDPSNDYFNRSGQFAHEAFLPNHYRGLSEPVVVGK